MLKQPIYSLKEGYHAITDWQVYYGLKGVYFKHYADYKKKKTKKVVNFKPIKSGFNQESCVLIFEH